MFRRFFGKNNTPADQKNVDKMAQLHPPPAPSPFQAEIRQGIRDNGPVPGVENVSHHDIRSRQTTRSGPVPHDPQGLQQAMTASRQQQPAPSQLSDVSHNEIQPQNLPNNKPPSPPQQGRSRGRSRSPAPQVGNPHVAQARQNVQTQPPPPGPEYQQAQEMNPDRGAQTKDKPTVRDRALSANKQPSAPSKAPEKSRDHEPGH